MNAQDRKIVLIKKEFQYRLILKFIVLVLAGAVISGTMLYFMASRDLVSSYLSAHQAIRSTRDILLPSILVSGAVSVVLIAAATAYVTLYVSHKIAGPLYKVEQILRRIGEGDLTVECHFRRHDELASLGEAVNDMTASLREKIGRGAIQEFRFRRDVSGNG